MMRTYNETIDGALKIFGGAILGVGAGLLFAPRSGKKTRKAITRFATDIGETTAKTFDGIAGSVAELAGAANAKVDNLLYEGKAVTREAKKGLLAVINKGHKEFEAQKRKVAAMMG